jgi:hypothetical protein
VKLCYFLPSGDFSFHGEVRGGEYHEVQIGVLAMEAEVFVLLSSKSDLSGRKSKV